MTRETMLTPKKMYPHFCHLVSGWYLAFSPPSASLGAVAGVAFADSDSICADVSSDL